MGREGKGGDGKRTRGKKTGNGIKGYKNVRGEKMGKGRAGEGKRENGVKGEREEKNENKRKKVVWDVKREIREER